jgi:hypothetical protein
MVFRPVPHPALAGKTVQLHKPERKPSPGMAALHPRMVFA